MLTAQLDAALPILATAAELAGVTVDNALRTRLGTMFYGRMISATCVRASAERPELVKVVGVQRRSSETFGTRWASSATSRQLSVT